MVIYSYSRLNTFEQCPLKFKYKYIDKIPETKITIEAYLGKTVHRTLEWLYSQVKQNKIPTIEEVIIFYSRNWEREYKSTITIIKQELTIEDYFNKGIKFLLDYYTKNKPFKDNTLEVEKRIFIDLGENYKLQGFIDRFVYNLKSGEYEIHDYKTANNLPPQNRIDNDKQLALYSIGIKELLGKEKKVCLIWHYLAHNKKICSRRTDEQLEQLKKETIALIKKIESTTRFPPYISKLCDWCDYKDMCSAWKGKD